MPYRHRRNAGVQKADAGSAKTAHQNGAHRQHNPHQSQDARQTGGLSPLAQGDIPRGQGDGTHRQDNLQYAKDRPQGLGQGYARRGVVDIIPVQEQNQKFQNHRSHNPPEDLVQDQILLTLTL